MMLNKIRWLDDLGRKGRNAKDPVLENIIGQLQKLAVEHEIDKKTGDSYIHVEKANESDEEL
jgi:H+-transporting ATPase